MDRRKGCGDGASSSISEVMNPEEGSWTPRPRWCPTPQQIQLLEFLFSSGTVTPSREMIVQIAAELRKYGGIGEANVFYWFQNRKARTKRKMLVGHAVDQAVLGQGRSSTRLASQNAGSSGSVSWRSDASAESSAVVVAASCDNQSWDKIEAVGDAILVDGHHSNSLQYVLSTDSCSYCRKYLDETTDRETTSPSIVQPPALMHLGTRGYIERPLSSSVSQICEEHQLNLPWMD